jgi:hypothetical protein
MEMAAPDNTLPMMTGFGQFGPIEMGGMFTVLKVRPGLKRDDYKDPGWYRHPEGTVAFAYDGPSPALQSPGREPQKPDGTADKLAKPGQAGKPHPNH